ncbi:MAG: glycoside hydrolase family 92 protein [Chitinophagaceae bacterium]|nr:MAG: glycoside hydrolase family 92 protein [Chitinophagaceae bacterium]
MLHRFLSFCAIVFAVGACSPSKQNQANSSLVAFVDPFIGTASHGHVFLGASQPFGAVQLGPVNMTEGWDWCSGYNYSDSILIGFSHTHLSGTGIGDLGDIMLMPVTGTPDSLFTTGYGPRVRPGYYSLYSHNEESAAPGYYSVRLKRYNVQAELTATQRVGFHQYHFPATDTAGIMIDLESGIGWDSPVETSIQLVNDTTITGIRKSRGWAKKQEVYFTALFSQPIRSVTVYDSATVVSTTAASGRKLRAFVRFGPVKDLVRVKVGISPVSVENAAGNIAAELPGWDFAAAKKEAAAQWEKELSKIRIRTTDTARLKTFYTSLYHTMISPSLFNDHNGDYRGTDGKVYKKATFSNYTTFSLWDTYRAANPLFTITQPARVNDMVSSMLAIYQQQGKLPVWHLVGNETNTMPGNSSVQVVADAYLKGLRGFDTALAWEAVRATQMQDARGMSFVKSLGFIPADSMVESVAMGLEYAISDWAVAEMAKNMGKQSDYELFSARAGNYRNYFDTTIRFVRGRVSESQWRTPFNPSESRHMYDDFAEGNSWQYSWMIPHDVEGLIRLMGGKDAFNKKLDSLFSLKADMGKDASPDISGLIGMYAHGNEPSHHITYLYSFSGQPWKTADKVRYILDSLYSDRYDGICGNEDAGQMSAWYVLSALGIYQVNPAGGHFVFGSPVIDDAIIDVGNGNTLHIEARNNSRVNRYIQSVTRNGQPFPLSYIDYADLMSGGSLVFEMGPSPSGTWGISNK